MKKANPQCFVNELCNGDCATCDMEPWIEEDKTMIDLKAIEDRLNEGRTIRRIDVKELLAEVKRLNEALKGAKIIAESAGQTITTLKAKLAEVEAELKILREDSAELALTKSRLHEVEAERDKAIEDMRKLCGNCFHYYSSGKPQIKTEPCRNCHDHSNWRYRGIK